VTLLLASVRSPEEARIGLEAGADLIDLKEPALGALGAVDPRTAQRVVALVDGRVPVSATVGDLGGRDARLPEVAAALVEAGVDILKVGCFDAHAAEAIETLSRRHPGQAVVAVAFAEDPWRELPLARFMASEVRLLMLDTREKGTGSLLTKLAVNELSALGAATAAQGLALGLAGGLTLADLPQVLALGPAVVGLRGALCDGAREGGLSVGRMAAARAAVPRQTAAGKQRRWRHDFVA